MDCVFCQLCNCLLVNNEQPGTPCPGCDVPVRRNNTARGEAGNYEFTGYNVELKHTSYPETLLSLAQELIAKQQFSVTVVVAQMACEISVERAISRAFSTKQVEYLEEAINDLLASPNLTNPKVRKLYSALTSDNIERQPFWKGLTDLNKWRKAAVHGGRICTEQEAEASLDVATKLVEYLKNS